MSAESLVVRDTSLLVPLAAETPGHVAGLAHAAQAWLQRHDTPESWRALAFTLADRAARRPWPFRAVAIATSGHDLRTGLHALVHEPPANGPTNELINGLSDGSISGPTGSAAHGSGFTGNLLDEARSGGAAPHGKGAFLVGGTGAQWPGMGSVLRASHAVFRGAIDDCAGAFARHVRWSLHAQLDAAPGDSRLAELEIGAMSTFAVCVALDRLLRSWGVVPDAIAGHSMGEIVGAHLAGALTLEDATRILYHWCEVQRRRTRPGQMLVVGLPVADVCSILADHRDAVSIAAINSPKSTTLSGEAASIQQIHDRLTASGVFCRLLKTGGAFHSHEMESLRDPLLAGIATVSPRGPEVAFYSTVQVDGRLPSRPPGFEAMHWWHNLRNPVDLAGAMSRMIDDGVGVFWELGPHTTLASAIAECVEAKGRDAAILGTLQRGEDDVASVLRSVGKLYVQGGEVNWRAIYRDREYPLAELPDIEPRALATPRSQAMPLGALVATRRESWSELVRRAVIAAAAELLGVPASDIPTTRSWIEVGLESLHAVKLRAYLRKQFQVDVPLARVLSSRSIADFIRDLEREIERRAGSPAESPIEPQKAGGAAASPVIPGGVTAADVNDLPAEVVHALLAQLVEQCSQEELAAMLQELGGAS
ncbi:MAG TPA: acyltransferase domain-containing protein [Kofleriaceae bacterium]|nr:acyltransferase domain-containing protein [Kofleriaceae bacterium]